MIRRDFFWSIISKNSKKERNYRRTSTFWNYFLWTQNEEFEKSKEPTSTVYSFAPFAPSWRFFQSLVTPSPLPSFPPSNDSTIPQTESKKTTRHEFYSHYRQTKRPSHSEGLERKLETEEQIFDRLIVDPWDKGWNFNLPQANHKDEERFQSSFHSTFNHSFRFTNSWNILF